MIPTPRWAGNYKHRYFRGTTRMERGGTTPEEQRAECSAIHPPPSPSAQQVLMTHRGLPSATPTHTSRRRAHEAPAAMQKCISNRPWFSLSRARKYTRVFHNARWLSMPTQGFRTTSGKSHISKGTSNTKTTTAVPTDDKNGKNEKTQPRGSSKPRGQRATASRVTFNLSSWTIGSRAAKWDV